MTDRNRELVRDSGSLVRERALTTGLFVRKDGIVNTVVCRRAELQHASTQKASMLSSVVPNCVSLICSP